MAEPRDGGRSALASRLLDGPCLLLDGGLGTMLQARGLRPGDAPDRMNLEQPAIVTAVHAAYVEAGSEAVHANSFGANPARLAHFGLAPRCEEINRRAVELARAARPAFVIADIGPTGEYLPPIGNGDLERWSDGFRRQAAALLESGADGIHLETFSDLQEALAALRAVRGLSLEVPVLASLTFDRRKRGFFTVMGNPLVPSLRQLLEEGATVAGANCTLGSRDMAALAAEALASLADAGGRLVFQANAGQPRPAAAGVVYDQDPAEFVADLEAAIAGGAAAIGGCCGTEPRHIRLLAERLRRGRR